MEQLRWRRLDPLSFELVITPDHCPLVLDDPETEFYAADWLPQARTSHGIQLVLTLSPDELDAEMAFPDAATWCVSELGVRQEGYSHAGFRGSARELHRKARERPNASGHMRGLICANHRTPLNPQPAGDGSCRYLLERELADEYYISSETDQGHEDPKCPTCGSWLRSETVMFGQPMPVKAMAQARKVDSFSVRSSLMRKYNLRLP
eukprot:TRINITY_DN5873_c0_g2_i2.p1 TRINITY_DN5873_c0_g2~~TRINITY_DN5873_c0_g2_i2.p1  ORF type:complete len:207 (+),score=42.54 TRINITY_DN5873_c0_g2_i2:219-839(+)